jgi:hypothetical protein
MYGQSREKIAVERRRRKRYRIREGALVFVGRIPAEITDISQDGLGLRFPALEKLRGRELSLDIFFSEQGFYLPAVPGTLVSDIEFSSTAAFSSVRVRRFGIRFGDLSPEQASRLQEFILHNTVAEA